MDLAEKTLEKKTLYRGKIINLRGDTALIPGGRSVLREVVEHPGGVCVAALTQEGELLFVRQFRYPFMEVLLELPAGKLSPGEEPLACGRRELLEETGATALRYESLGELYPSPGYSNEIIYLFEGRGLSYGEQQPDDDEFIEVVRIPLEEAARRVLSGEIKDAKTQAAVLKLWSRRCGEALK
ncbi:MAG: NUDIX hydrolase [Clostridia bacterium]|nr:NUDIX hydrolase [Clostridia bacterium]